MVPFGPCPTVPAGDGIPGAWLEPGLELEPAILARAGLLRAVSMDMGRRLREVGSRPRPAGGHLHRPVSRGAARQPGAGRGPPRVLERAALARRPGSRQALQGRPLVAAQEAREAHRRAGRHARPDQGRRRRGLARLHAQGSRPRHLRARPLARGRRGADHAAALAAWPAAASSRSSASAKRSANTATGSSPRSASGSTKAAPRRSTTRSA